MTKQQLAQASKLFMELGELFREASLTTTEVSTVEGTHVIQPLVEVENVITDEPTTTEEVVETVEETVNDLSTMTIQQLRSLAKSHGLSTKGTKKDLIARITEGKPVSEEQPTEEVVEETVEEVIEETPVVEDEIEEVEEIEESEDEIEEVIEDEEDEVEELEDEELDQMEVIQAELEQMSLEELQEILESVDLSTKGKKQALISRIIEAVEDGILEFEEEEIEDVTDEDYEEDEELDEVIDDVLEEDEDEDYEVEEIEEEEDDFEDEDEEEELSPREITQQEIEEEIAEAYENGDLTDKEIAKFLEDYFNGTFKPINRKRAYNKFVEIQCDLVDVDGDRMDMKEAYYVNDEEIYCCGSEIKELDNGNLFCEVCGTEYETE